MIFQNLHKFETFLGYAEFALPLSILSGGFIISISQQLHSRLALGRENKSRKELELRPHPADQVH